jgi:hypothetical protein
MIIKMMNKIVASTMIMISWVSKAAGPKSTMVLEGVVEVTCKEDEYKDDKVVVGGE